ncbi:MAG: replication initiator protein [Microviridae sp.]|nr:MAG: replication initiator protein [Microviridae sp.]
MGQTYCTEDGQILRPPFLRMSLRPALGKNWLHAYKNDLSQGYLVTDGQKGRIPSYYKKKLNELDKFLAEQSRFKASQAPRPRDDLEAAERIHLRKAMLAATAKGETGARFGV